ncbi:MAG: DUF4136 domain-containing protein [Planctomycetota bacterium]|jgi:hypothetical protein
MVQARGTLGVLLALVVVGCASRMEVNSYYDPTASFSEVKSFAWLPRKDSGDPLIDDDLLEQRVQTAVDAGMAAKGYQKTSSTQPDVWLGYHAVLQRQTSVQKVSDTYYYDNPEPAWSDTFASDLRPAEVEGYEDSAYNEGMLVLDIADGKTRELIWRGSASMDINLKAKSSQRAEKVREAIAKILKLFPPGNEKE